MMTFVESTCASAGLRRDDCLRLALVVEELFVNTIVHGHGGDSDATIDLTLDPQPGRIRVTYEDRAPRFDPSAGAEELAAAQESAELDERPVGGLGLLLVRKLSSDLEYSRAVAGNRIAFVITSP